MLQHVEKTGGKTGRHLIMESVFRLSRQAWWDVATPATFIRYTGNWRGSIQGWMPSKDFLAAKPLRKELPGLKNFYMTGHWVEPSGGITPAVKTGRDIAWIICSRDGKKFKTAK